MLSPKIRVTIAVWDITPRSLERRYKCFGTTSNFHPQNSTVKFEAWGSPETVILSLSKLEPLLRPGTNKQTNSMV
jgi:hypothetical protein